MAGTVNVEGIVIVTEIVAGTVTGIVIVIVTETVIVIRSVMVKRTEIVTGIVRDQGKKRSGVLRKMKRKTEMEKNSRKRRTKMGKMRKKPQSRRWKEPMKVTTTRRKISPSDLEAGEWCLYGVILNESIMQRWQSFSTVKPISN